MKFVVRVDTDLRILIPGYLEHRKEDVQALHSALGARDFLNIERLGHIMKGSGGGYGFDFISEIGERIEESAKHKKTDEIVQQIKELEEYLSGVEVVYV